MQLSVLADALSSTLSVGSSSMPNRRAAKRTARTVMTGGAERPTSPQRGHRIRARVDLPCGEDVVELVLQMIAKRDDSIPRLPGLPCGAQFRSHLWEPSATAVICRHQPLARCWSGEHSVERWRSDAGAGAVRANASLGHSLIQ